MRREYFFGITKLATSAVDVSENASAGVCLINIYVCFHI